MSKFLNILIAMVLLLSLSACSADTATLAPEPTTIGPLQSMAESIVASETAEDEGITEASIAEENTESTTSTSLITVETSTPKFIKGTVGEQNALRKANAYLDFAAFSYQGLVKQLEYEGFTQAEAVFGADNCGADWNEQAYQKALSYLDFTSFSHEGLIEQLEFEGFSHEDAVSAADNCGADWNEQAAKKAKSYLDFTSFSRDGLIEQLEFEGFTHAQAAYGADAVGY